MSLIGLLTATEKTGSPRPPSHATYTMAPQKQLVGSRVTRKGDSHPQVLAPALTMARQRQCSHRPAITPYKTCTTNIYRRVKRRVGRSLKLAHYKGNLVPTRKQAAYKLLRTQSSFLSIKRVSKTRVP